jgi:alkanesulfonate monooxygenase SsuD/methylene tetrahydromethanopterin reductase-like flavin-dependent oxidoreductase (luciferase family)
LDWVRGWVRADYDQSGIAFDPAAERIERLEENIEILRKLFAAEPVTLPEGITRTERRSRYSLLGRPS